LTDNQGTQQRDLELIRPGKREIAPFERSKDLRGFATRIWEREQEYLRVFRSIEQNSEDLQEELRILGFRLRNLKTDINSQKPCEDLLKIMEDSIQNIDTLRQEQDYLIALSTARFETSVMFDLLSLLRASLGDWFPEKPPTIRGDDPHLVLTCDRHWTRVLLDRVFHHLNQNFDFRGDVEVRLNLETPSTIFISVSISDARSIVRRGEEIPRLSIKLMRSIAQKLEGHFWIDREKATDFRQFESEERFPDRTVEVRNFKKVSMCIILPGKRLT
jgi:hypothetical protein